MGKKFTKTKVPRNGSNRVKFVKEFLHENYDIKVNIFDTSRVTIVPKTRDYDYEIDVKDINLHMIEEGITGSFSILRDVITSPNQTTPWNPILEYFESVKGAYKGESHIDLLCSFLKAHDYGDKEDGYYQKRLVYTYRKWLVATVACAMGLKENDAMFTVVNSATGIGKSSLLEFAVPDELMPYCVKSKKNMNFTKMFTTNLFINFDEMDGLTRSISEEFKKLLSSRQLNVSNQFTNLKQRYASPFGSSNYDDEHGGFILPEWSLRRFAVNRIDEINWEGYSKVVVKNQIWAECMMLLEQDFDYVWNQNDFKEFEEYNQRFLVQTSSYRLVKEFYRVPGPGEEGEFKQPMDILRDLRKARKVSTSMSAVNEINIGIALKQLGFARFGKKLNNGTRYGYNVVPLF